MSAQKHPEFGTGLRSALERRGTLRSHVAPVAAFRLLAREPLNVGHRHAAFAGGRLAPAA
jgi:hypothetical protein